MTPSQFIDIEKLARAVAAELRQDPAFRELVRRDLQIEEELWDARRCCEHLRCAPSTFYASYARKLTPAPNTPGTRYRAGDVIALTKTKTPRK